MINNRFTRTDQLTQILLKESGIIEKNNKNNKYSHLQTDIATIHKVPMKGIILITSIDDIIDILENTNYSISFNGTKHTMGGHTLIENGIRIDTRAFNKILDINLIEKTVTIQTGITWSDLIVFLNKFGLSPQIMQSYSGFSVGGSLFAHGILCNYNIAHSIKSLKILLPNKKCYEIKPKQKLFEYVIGTFGTIGFIYEITLNVVPNDKLKFIESKTISTDTGLNNFRNMITKLSSTEEQSKSETEIKFIRINNDFETMKLHRYIHAGNIASNLSPDAPSLSKINSIIFHWFAHWNIFKSFRKFTESIKSVHLDAVYTTNYEKLVDRNVFAYEDQENVSGKLSYLDATHVLQEYFLPFEENLPYELIAKLKNEFNNEEFGCNLLNLTARIVKKDEYPFILSYSPNNDMCAFVLYIRLGCDKKSIENLKQKQIRLNQYCVENGGTFYLPYLHHYTKEQLLKAYPRILEFIKLKNQIDPTQRFLNEWYKNIENLFKEEIKSVDLTNIDNILSESKEIQNNEEYSKYFIFDKTKNTNKNSIIKTMIKNKFMSNQFKLFLENVFNIYKSEEILNLLENNDELSDKDIYTNILIPKFNSNIRNPFNVVNFLIQINRSLNNQLKEIHFQISETVNMLRVNKNNVCSILNVGDKGRYNQIYKKMFPNSKRNYVMIDWTTKEKSFYNYWFNGMIEEKINDNNNRKHDIIFSLAGLHHYSLDDLKNVLEHCQKTIKIGGYFILRDHDVTNNFDNDLVDNAHSIFNGLTGETYITEINEARYMRSKKGWENLMKEYGFESMFEVDYYDKNNIKHNQLLKISSVQKHDPTRNIMMCFKYVGSNEEKNEIVNLKKNKLTISSIFKIFLVPIIFLFKIFELFFNFRNNQKNKVDQNNKLSESHKLIFNNAGGKTKENFNSVAQIPEWYNVLYAEKYPELLIDYPWFHFPYMKSFYQMIDICVFAYYTEKQNNSKISSDAIMAMFVIICHCVGCLISSFFANLINKIIKKEDIGGTRQTLVKNPNKKDLETEIIFRNVAYKSVMLKKLDDNMYLIEIPMYRPFTEIVKKWFELDDDITICLISGNNKVWVDVRGKINDELKKHKSLLNCQIKTIPDLLKKDEYVSYVNLDVNKLRELYKITILNDSNIVQIFQQ